MKLRMFLGDHLVSIALYITAFASILLLLSLFRVHFFIAGDHRWNRPVFWLRDTVL